MESDVLLLVATSDEVVVGDENAIADEANARSDRQEDRRMLMRIVCEN